MRYAQEFDGRERFDSETQSQFSVRSTVMVIRALAASLVVLAALPATAKADVVWDLVQPGSMGLLATGLIALTGAGLLRRRANK